MGNLGFTSVSILMMIWFVPQANEYTKILKKHGRLKQVATSYQD
jgi:hypothetical protein